MSVVCVKCEAEITKKEAQIVTEQFMCASCALENFDRSKNRNDPICKSCGKRVHFARSHMIGGICPDCRLGG